MISVVSWGKYHMTRTDPTDRFPQAGQRFALRGAGPAGILRRTNESPRRCVDDGARLQLESEPVSRHPSSTSIAGEGRKAHTQERILSAAMDLFLRRGYERTSVTLIARGAGVSRGAVFWHFGDKETLFREACRRFVAPFREQLGGRLAFLPARKRVFELVAAYESFVADNHDRIAAFVRWVLDSPVHSRVLRDHLVELHEEFRREFERALVELVEDPAEAASLADGFVSLMDGNLLLGIVGGAGDGERLRAGLDAVVARVLPEEDR